MLLLRQLDDVSVVSSTTAACRIWHEMTAFQNLAL
jgi:hypothetical protein